MVTTGGAADTTTTPTCSIAKDTANFAACSNAPFRKTLNSAATNVFHLVLTADEMNADVVGVMVSGSGCVPYTTVMETEADYTSTKAGYIDTAISGAAKTTDVTGAVTSINSHTDTAVGGISIPTVSAIQSGLAKTTDVTGAQSAINGHTDTAIGGISIPTVSAIQSGLAKTTDVTSAQSAINGHTDTAIGGISIPTVSAIQSGLAKTTDVTGAQSAINGHTDTAVGGISIPTVSAIQSGLAKTTDVTSAQTAINAHTDTKVDALSIPTVAENQSGLAKITDVSGAVTSINNHTDGKIDALDIPTAAENQSGLAKASDVVGAANAVIQALPEDPDNTGIQAIKAKTDRLSFAEDGSVNANVAGNVEVTVGSVEIKQTSIDAVRSGLAQQDTLRDVSTKVNALSGSGDGSVLRTYKVQGPDGIGLAGVVVSCFRIDPSDSHYIPQGKQTSGADGVTNWMVTKGSTYHFYREDPSGGYSFDNPDIEVAE